MAKLSPSNASRPGGPATGPITPELVREIADRVYAMLLRDLRLERERRRETSTARRLSDANR